MSLKLTSQIDEKNNKFILSVKKKLENLSLFSEASLEFLMMEHYQFSVKNTQFLAAAQATTQRFNLLELSAELQRNLNEEKGHAAIYKKSLLEIGTDVEKRAEFIATEHFFSIISDLVLHSPYITLGAMYATETAAIFEHEVFLEISHEVINRREKPWEKSRLKAFHDLHLNGVEQAHKDELGIFVDQDDQDTASILTGANQAIQAMDNWWKHLLAKAANIL